MSQLLSLLGWWFLPNFATNLLQNLYYGITIRAGDPKPQPGSPRFIKHRKAIFVLVIASYLVYTVYEADYNLRLRGDFYQDLGVRHDVDERALQSHFRKLTIRFHPDKVSAEERPQAEARFVHLKLARDVLLDPAKRFAYDRFGPEIVGWRHCSTIRDFVLAGGQAMLPYYVLSGISLVILGILGLVEAGRYWRFVVFSGMLVLEVHTIMRPTFPAIATKVLNPIFRTLGTHPDILPFQTLELARKFAIAIFIAVQQISPVLRDASTPTTPQAMELHQNQQLNRLNWLLADSDTELSRLLGLELAPFQGDEQTLGQAKLRVRDWMVQNTINNIPEVRDAIGRVRERKRRDAPAGAKGTK